MPYHHGDLRRALLDAALLEVEAVGPSRLSLREVARRAGVSHAAPAHHFGDKTGLFTALAAEGFTLLAAGTASASEEDGALLGTALAYVRFAVGHRAHFEVMWRPDLLRRDDPELVAARSRSFDVFYRTVAESIPSARGDDFQGAVAAAWSMVHGFATLWLAGNFPPEMGDDPMALALLTARGVVAVAEVAARQLPGPPTRRAR